MLLVYKFIFFGEDGFKGIGVYVNYVKKIYYKCFINDIFFNFRNKR